MYKGELKAIKPEDLAGKEMGKDTRDSSKIELPEDPKEFEVIVKRLQNKLEDYKSRLKQQEETKEPAYKIADTKLKIYVSEEILTMGTRFNAYDLSLKLSKSFKKEGREFDLLAFDSAYKVIKDYCETGGENVVWGTGF